MSRSAITTASSRSGSNAMVMTCVGVSAIGHSSVMSPRTCNSKVPIKPVSIAVMQTSPSPCAPWPSPTENIAPSIADRQIKRRAGDQFLIVDVAAVAPRRRRGDRAPGRRRRRRHDAEERLQRQFEAPRQPADHARAIERNVDEAHLLEIVRQGSNERPDHVVAPVVVQIDRLDADFEHLSGLGAAHGHRSGEDVRSAELRLHLCVNCRQRRRATVKPERASGICVGAPDTVEMTMVSPGSIVISGLSAASK